MSKQDDVDQKWFEMEDIRSRTLARRSWIPICSYTTVKKDGEFGKEGYREELAFCDSVMVPVESKEAALKFEWMDVMVSHANGPWVDDDGVYHEAGLFKHYESGIHGRYLVLRQRIDGEAEDWHLDQDFVLGLKLSRKGDFWIAPEEEDLEVVRLFRDDEGRPVRLEIRAEHLRDYLAARECGLLIARYHSRAAIEKSFPQIDWPEPYTIPFAGGLWEGRLRPIHHGGFPAGESWAVVHVSRHGPELQEDVPDPGFPTDNTTKSESWTRTPTGDVIIHAIGECWKDDWVELSLLSRRVREDKVPSSQEFITENDGTTTNAEDLKNAIRWLWFDPAVVKSLLVSRHSTLSWYTGDTGRVGSRPSRSVHFGMNGLGLVNVFAKDIALLPEIDQKKWAAHNLSPEGGVSKELLQSQMEARPAETIAPEELLWQGLEYIQQIFTEKYGTTLLRNLPSKDDFHKRINRFVAINQEGLCLLAKEITRVITDQIDIKLLRTITNEKTKELRSLKLLERLLTDLNVGGHLIMRPPFGTYDLRTADAHPSSDDLNDAMSLLGIDRKESSVINGKIMIQNIMKAIMDIIHVLSEKDYALPTTPS